MVSNDRPVKQSIRMTVKSSGFNKLGAQKIDVVHELLNEHHGLFQGVETLLLKRYAPHRSSLFQWPQ